MSNLIKSHICIGSEQYIDDIFVLSQYLRKYGFTNLIGLSNQDLCRKLSSTIDSTVTVKKTQPLKDEIERILESPIPHLLIISILAPLFINNTERYVGFGQIQLRTSTISAWYEECRKQKHHTVLFIIDTDNESCKSTVHTFVTSYPHLEKNRTYKHLENIGVLNNTFDITVASTNQLIPPSAKAEYYYQLQQHRQRWIYGGLLCYSILTYDLIIPLLVLIFNSHILSAMSKFLYLFNFRPFTFIAYELREYLNYKEGIVPYAPKYNSIRQQQIYDELNNN